IVGRKSRIGIPVDTLPAWFQSQEDEASRSDGALSAARLLSCCYSRSSRSVWLPAIGFWLFANRFSSLLVSESVSDVPISNPTIGELDKKEEENLSMQSVRTFNVSPRLPAVLEPLNDLARNLWWTWEPEARKLFRDLNPTLWDQTNHNPIRMLQLSKQGRLEEIASDEDYLRRMRHVHDRFQAYMNRTDTYGKQRAGAPCIAYFSAEFGFHESVPNYSGGLGILSGDHCKSASDLELYFYAVTLLYRHGYFKQQIGKDGWQEAVSLNQNFHHLPVRDARVGDQSVFVTVDILGRDVTAKVWELQIGRIKLFLLDTDIQQNSPEDRLITEQLYGGKFDMRIRQEIVLGIGGVRALDAMDIKPDVFHMNEGHSAFLSLERILRYVQVKR